jgi:translation initiation factor eIF-2B subunit alpha
VLQFDEENLLKSQSMPKIPETPSRPLLDSEVPTPLEMTAEQVQNNPLLDYTTPDLVTLVICDVGILTPSVSLAMEPRTRRPDR